ncbi:hypothetical protein ACFVVX_21795 [Kitasatospora sp. NPDC058170]|uniref:hypothetical protein n=1 Tax=Kitasatospora sp. NPDC058170 TaxID=3346364 RepID=UPI0036DDB126
MPSIPLICPRCGREQQVVPGGPERAVKVVHAGTGREACEPADLAREPGSGLPGGDPGGSESPGSGGGPPEDGPAAG